MQQSYHYNHPFSLENGAVLPELHIGYTTYGQLNKAGDNVVWICHALTASSDAADWWAGMVGKGMAFDPDRHFIVCANILGSCYGSTGPLSIDKSKGTPYYSSFPLLSIRDMVQAHILLRQHLGIEQIHLLAGGSMGGYQALEWALTEPQRIDRLFLLATSAAESAWGIAVHTAQRIAIEADASFGEESPAAGARGMKAARAIGMLTYRNYELMVQQQTDPDPEKTDHFKASSYMHYQGDKLVRRFNAYSYYVLSKAMDSHNLSRGRGGHIPSVLAGLQQPVLLIGISSDMLCPPEEQRQLAAHLPHCRYEEITSPYGHDGFLVETEQISILFQQWLKR
ncbi:homoserine O-acetyltransferase MetX [Taibaiella helva]|uniref:homoserine O-acetyltransferase MetX n=1 Tax=Taibaiella helva TaxID=2301235 RepID=UPI000E58209F|nr:homoserine O-acetyltransferase [Taibaiella helva]